MRGENIIRIALFCGLTTGVALFFLPSSAVPGFFVDASSQSDAPSQAPAGEEAEPAPQRKPNNPLLAEYKRRAQELNINLDFTAVVRTLVPYDARLNKDSLDLEIFCEEPRSLDVLLIGDSTMAWGVIPSVVEQRTGRETGMFAMRSMYLNVRSMRLVERLQKYYLKPGGITLFGFAIWTQLQEPDIVRRSELFRLTEYSDEEFERFVAERRAGCDPAAANAAPKARAQVSAPRMFSRASLEGHTKDLELLREDLRSTVGFLRESAVSRAFREWAHPAWFNKHGPVEQPPAPPRKQSDTRPDLFGDYREKISMGSFQFIRWDHQTLTATGPFALRSIPSHAPFDPGFTVNENHRINARSLLKIPGRKAFIITIYPEHRSYIVQRSIYNALYKDQLDLIDLGVRHPDDKSFSMDNEGHPANLGGLEKSIMIAEWLRENSRE